MCFWCTGNPLRGRNHSIKTALGFDGDHYLGKGRKVWTTKALDSERVLLLVRTESKGCGRQANRGDDVVVG
ncbi:MAG: hypothetical protein Ct9H300mP8_03200 [Gammaproteobacteria bacterium]|nr:MAG: hypothetical protein Ct9H300mP8_03200 [Gammaproteobacteria bacterium]